MSMNSIQELNKLWHIVGMCMKNEMYSGKYTNNFLYFVQNGPCKKDGYRI